MSTGWPGRSRKLGRNSRQEAPSRPPDAPRGAADRPRGIGGGGSRRPAPSQRSRRGRPVPRARRLRRDRRQR
jgi:hypothetical protein